MTTEWTDPDDAPSATIIYGPRGEKLRVWKEIGKRDCGFRAAEEDEQ